MRVEINIGNNPDEISNRMARDILRTLRSEEKEGSLAHQALVRAIDVMNDIIDEENRRFIKATCS